MWFEPVSLDEGNQPLHQTEPKTLLLPATNSLSQTCVFASAVRGSSSINAQSFIISSETCSTWNFVEPSPSWMDRIAHKKIQRCSKDFKGRKPREDNCPKPSRGAKHCPPGSASAKSIKKPRNKISKSIGIQRLIGFEWFRRHTCKGDLPLAFARAAHQTAPCQLWCRLRHLPPPGSIREEKGSEYTFIYLYISLYIQHASTDSIIVHLWHGIVMYSHQSKSDS